MNQSCGYIDMYLIISSVANKSRTIHSELSGINLSLQILSILVSISSDDGNFIPPFAWFESFRGRPLG